MRTEKKTARSTRLRRVVIFSSALLVSKTSSGQRFQALSELATRQELELEW
jgi:hypothetical protein